MRLFAFACVAQRVRHHAALPRRTIGVLDLDPVEAHAARDDAASFVASNGAIRGAQLEAALGAIRERLPEARDASDQTLAEAILAL